MKLAIFSEAGFEYGFGHFYRMAGICESVLRSGADAKLYLMADDSAKDALQGSYVDFIDWKDPYNYEELLNKDTILVIDSYHVDIHLLETFKGLAYDMIVIDDNCRLDYHDMKILNPNYYAVSLIYPDKNNALYVGKDYTLVRDEFVMNEERITKEKVEDILVTMGGTDPLGRTAQIVDMVRQVDKDVRIHVVCTSAYHNLETIRSSLNSRDTLYMNIDAKSMCGLMRSCDFAIASAGQTTNELIKMQCPAILVVVVENQLLSTKYLSEEGFITAMYDSDISIIRKMFSFDKRNELAEKLKYFYSTRSGRDFVCELLCGGGVDE